MTQPNLEWNSALPCFPLLEFADKVAELALRLVHRQRKTVTAFQLVSMELQSSTAEAAGTCKRRVVRRIQLDSEISGEYKPKE